MDSRRGEFTCAGVSCCWWEPVFRRASERCLGLGCGRQRVRRPRWHMGAGDFRARAAGRGRGREERCRARDELWHPQPPRGAHGRVGCQRRAVGGKGAHVQLWHRGDHVGDPSRPGLYQAQQDHQVRGVLPRAC